MEESKLTSADGGERTAVAPLTWDSRTRLPSGHMDEPTAHGTERTPTFEPADFGEDDDGGQTAITTTAYNFRPKFTGRNATIQKLTDLVERSYNARTLGFALVTGEPGTGKSRLLGELVARMRTQFPSVTVLSGADDGNAYGPIGRALASRFGLVAGEDIAESRDKIQAGVAEIVAASRVPELAHLVAHLLRVPFDDSPVVTPLLEQPQRLEARMFMALKRLFAADADRRPLLVVFENLETCGAETINLIQYLAAGLRDQRVMLITTATAALFERHHLWRRGGRAATLRSRCPRPE